MWSELTRGPRAPWPPAPPPHRRAAPRTHRDRRRSSGRLPRRRSDSSTSSRCERRGAAVTGRLAAGSSGRISVTVGKVNECDISTTPGALRLRVVEHVAQLTHLQRRPGTTSRRALVPARASPRVTHGIDGQRCTVDLGRSHANPAAVDRRVAAAVDDRATARRDPNPVAMAPHAAIGLGGPAASRRRQRCTCPSHRWSRPAMCRGQGAHRPTRTLRATAANRSSRRCAARSGHGSRRAPGPP